MISSVPKDYFNASAGIANIGFARHRAPHQPSKGSIMLNPGQFMFFYDTCVDIELTVNG
jgi:hypothetical protein